MRSATYLMRVTVLACVCGVVISGPGLFAGELHGEALFKKHCSSCHPKADNFVNFHKLEDIIDTMRNPPGPMPEFDEEKISEHDALKIAAYIRLQRYRAPRE